jgi:rod shape-determining protein MreC
MFALIKKFRLLLLGIVLIFGAFLVYAVNLPRKEHANAIERLILSLTSPLQRTVAAATSSANSFVHDYLDLVNVKQENRRLLEQLKLMNAREIANREALLANDRLTKLLGLRDSLQLPSITASVIGEDGYPWFKSIIINRGEADGIREGFPVVAAAGVVGQVTKISARSARVLLFTDNASAIAGMVQRTRARGVIKGKGGTRCSLEFTMREDDVKVGDQVVTSGIGRIFPKGLSIGEVTMVKKGEYGIFQSIELRPSVDLSRLEEVLVLAIQ